MLIVVLERSNHMKRSLGEIIGNILFGAFCYLFAIFTIGGFFFLNIMIWFEFPLLVCLGLVAFEIGLGYFLLMLGPPDFERR